MNSRKLVILAFAMSPLLSFCAWPPSDLPDSTKSEENIQANAEVAYSDTIPVYGNSWMVSGSVNTGMNILKNGITQWKENDTKFRTWFKVTGTGKLILAVRTRVNSGNATLGVLLGNVSGERQYLSEVYPVSVKNSEWADLYSGEFGNEGAGGQSYLRFFWKAGNTYRFLLGARPTENGETDFTAWFFAPEEGKWMLIASFRRPKTTVWVTRPHSFLENFATETGYISRQAFYGNQWIYTTGEEWIELTKMKFTADATARKEARLDYSGGVVNQSFFLKNCGFFNETTLLDSFFERKPGGKMPDINFAELP